MLPGSKMPRIALFPQFATPCLGGHRRRRFRQGPNLCGSVASRPHQQPTPSPFVAEPYDYTEVRRLAAALDLAEPIAVMLVRRGYRTVEQASDFLEARDDHDPFDFDGMEDVCDRVLALARRGGRITVHGDYDVDGVCSTTILVAALRQLGADADWLIPDRLADGYGLTAAGVEELSSRGTEMAITVDCGIGSAEEIAALRAAGIEAIVTDHHEPPSEGGLPDCPILHPVVSRLPVQRALRRRRRPQALDRAARGGRHAVHPDGGRPPRRRGGRARPGRAGHGRRPRSADRREPEARPPGAGGDAVAAASGRPGADGRGAGGSRGRGRAGARVPARASHQRRRPALPRGRRGRADADLRPRAGRLDRRRARPRQLRAPGDRARGGDGRRGGAPGVARGSGRRARPRARRRGLAPRRRRDRRVAPRRAPLAPGGPALDRGGHRRAARPAASPAST